MAGGVGRLPEADQIGRCLITGATGQIGSICVRQLNAIGVVPRVLMRRPLPSGGWQDAHVTEVPGDLSQLTGGAVPPPLRDALSRSAVVFHLAARVNLAGRGAADMLRLNREAAAALFSAARSAGVRRFVHVSTVGAVGCADSPHPLTEDAVYNLEAFANPYFDTKRAAEEGLLSAWQADPAPTELVVVNPSICIGRNMSFRRLSRRKAPRRPPAPGSILYKLICFWFAGGINLVDVRDVAQGIVSAAVHGTPGTRYILGGENITIRDLMLRLREIFGTGGPRIRIGPGILHAAALASEGWAALTGRRARFNRTLADLAGHYWFYDSSRAKRELGYHSRPLVETLEDLREWVVALRSASG
jgi:dihydroflavonol-4-reductase